MQNRFDALSSFVTTNVFTAKPKLDLGYKAKDHMRKEEVYPFPSYWIFFFLDIFGLFQTQETGLSNLNISR